MCMILWLCISYTLVISWLAINTKLARHHFRYQTSKFSDPVSKYGYSADTSCTASWAARIMKKIRSMRRQTSPSPQPYANLHGHQLLRALAVSGSLHFVCRTKTCHGASLLHSLVARLLLDVPSHTRGTFHDRIGSLVNLNTNSHTWHGIMPTVSMYPAAVDSELLFLQKASSTTRVSRRSSSYGWLQNYPCFCAMQRYHRV